MSGSLRGRLLAVLGGSVLIAWLATAFFTYVDARREIDAMLDSHLVQTAALLQALATEGAPAAAAPPPAAAGGAIAYRIWDGEGALLFASPEAPGGGAVAGFADVAWEGRGWRVYGTDAPPRVEVAQSHDVRRQLAGSVASHLLHPLAFAIPLLALVIWGAVNWGLRPLTAIARQVQHRNPANLEPLDGDSVPRETQPLVKALNRLFGQVVDLLERERRFTADAAHELRTPLAAIATHAQVALAAPDDAEARRAMHSVLRGTSRATRLVEQLLVLARLDPGGEETAFDGRVCLAEAVRGVVGEMGPLAVERGIDLGIAELDEAQVTGDPGLVAVLLRNLVDNAIRYTPPGGRVDVTVRRAAGVELRVEDDGPGIAPNLRRRVLDRFFRVLGSGQEGSGLGLSIAARIAERHGAVLSLSDAAAGRGLAVTVRFPAT